MTDYKQLCAELVEQLDDALGFTVSSETRRHMKLLTRKARAALAEPEPPSLKEKTLAEMELLETHGVHACCLGTLRRAIEQLPD